jgi:hypothetical protein
MGINTTTFLQIGHHRHLHDPTEENSVVQSHDSAVLAWAPSAASTGPELKHHRIS